MSRIEEIREDLKELKELRQSATRKCSQQILDDQIEKSARLLNNLLVQKATEEQKSPSEEASSKESSSKAYTVTLRTYSWDQSDKFMKLYVTIPSLQPSDAGCVSCAFTSRGVTLSVKGLSGKNYELVINNLAMNIVPEKSHKKVKDEMVVLLLSKARESVTWPAVTAEEAKIKEKNKPDSDPAKTSEDPSSNIMGLMKKMYDEGDDKMKQMLNKTWYESQMKTGGGGMPGMGGMGGMPGMGGMDGMPGMGGMGGMPGMGGMGGMPGMGGMGGMPGMGGLGDMPDIGDMGL